MKYIFSFSIIFILISQSLFADDVFEILKSAENRFKCETSQGKFTMIVTTPDYERTIKMESYNKGNDKALIIITYPPKEAGNKTLKIGKELWTYLKTTETTMKLPASMMLQSWNGSDLTNDDLVRESSLYNDYTLKLLLEEKINNELCWKIELVPKPDAPVVWGKIYYWVRKSDYNPALVQYYDEGGVKVRSMKFSDIKNIDGRIIPSKWTIINEKKKGNFTEFIYEDVKLDKPIPEKMFSFRELEK